MFKQVLCAVLFLKELEVKHGIIIIYLHPASVQIKPSNRNSCLRAVFFPITLQRCLDIKIL